MCVCRWDFAEAWLSLGLWLDQNWTAVRRPGLAKALQDLGALLGAVPNLPTCAQIRGPPHLFARIHTRIETILFGMNVTIDLPRSWNAMVSLALSLPLNFKPKKEIPENPSGVCTTKRRARTLAFP